VLIFAEITSILAQMSSEHPIKKLLSKREQIGNIRRLGNFDSSLIDFSSNDYLGLARSSELKRLIIEDYQQRSTLNGATGSRLLTGNTALFETTEEYLASLFGYASTLIFNSGYMANLAFFSSVPQKGDTVLYDELSHACIKDGIRLSFAKKLPFRHNDLEDLQYKMKQATGQVYVACESVYSMDGDLAPLAELALLCQQKGAFLIVDEAHSTGIWGNKGQGLVHELQLQEDVYAVIHTFGKAMGVHGASISGSIDLKEFLINFSRPFIYTTAPSDFEVLAITAAFEYLACEPHRQTTLLHNIKHFNKLTGQQHLSAIKTLVIGGNENTKKAAIELQKSGFDIRPIVSPTVQTGTERLRICLHSFNSEAEISSLAEQLKKTSA